MTDPRVEAVAEEIGALSARTVNGMVVLVMKLGVNQRHALMEFSSDKAASLGRELLRAARTVSPTLTDQAWLDGYDAGFSASQAYEAKRQAEGVCHEV